MSNVRAPAGEPGQRAGEVVLAAAAAGIVLAPYATVAMPYGRALIVQAVLVLGIVLVVLAAGFVRGGWLRRVLRTRSEIAFSVALWAGVTVLAGAVGLARDNAIRDVAGQALALGLLPLAVIAAWGVGSTDSGRPVALGLFGGTVVATLIQFAHWLLVLDSPGFDPRLFMANQVAPLGPALLALLAGAALAFRARGRARAAGLVGLALIGAYIVLSGTRGLWLVTPIGLLVLITLARLWSARLVVGAVAAALAFAAALWGGLAASRAWLERPRPNLVPDPVRDAHAWIYPAGAALVPIDPASTGRFAYNWSAQPKAGQAAVTAPFAVTPGRLVRIRARLTIGCTEPCGLALWLVDPAGRPCVRHGLLLPPRSPGRLVSRIVPVPGGAVAAQVVVTAGTDGLVSFADLEVNDLGPAFLWPLYLQWRTLSGRADSLVAGPVELASSQRSVSVRLGETRRLLELFASAGMPRRMLGHGLGARYAFEVGGLDGQGNKVIDRNPNYIHNFYMFLLFKTGLVGALAIMTALALWLRAAFVGAWRETAAWPCLWSAAVAGALVAYCVWGVASPELINFRVAPLFGLVLAGLAEPAPAGAQTGSRADD